MRSPADPFATAMLVDGDTVAWVGSEQGADALTADRTVHLDDAWVAHDTWSVPRARGRVLA